jgi:hypothetical protein
MKIDSFIQDICELKNEDSENRETFEFIAEQASIMEARLINIYKNKVGDDDLLDDIDMDELDEFPYEDSNSELSNFLDTEL